jgi:superoxide dismutase, Fe-Mn family
MPLSPSLFLQRAPRRRSLHTIPELSYKWPEDEGQSQLLSRFGFDVSWNQYQSMLLNKLNVLTMGGSLPSLESKPK